MRRNRIYTNGSCEAGFSLPELIVSLVLTLVILGIAVTAFSSVLGSRTRASSTTDGITSAQAALNIMSREIGNAGFGLNTNGLGWLDSAGVYQTDCTEKRLRLRTNTSNSGANRNTTSGAGEDVTFYFDSASQSVVRSDANFPPPSGVINRVSNVTFSYFDDAAAPNTPTTVPTAGTSRVRILLAVTLQNVQGQPVNRQVTVKSDVTLRNSPYHLGQY